MEKEKNIFKKVDKAKDKLFKTLFHSMGQVVFSRLDIDEKIKEVYPTEIITSEFKSLMMDIVFKTCNGEMTIVEFHSGDLKEKKLKKILPIWSKSFRKNKSSS